MCHETLSAESVVAARKLDACVRGDSIEADAASILVGGGISAVFLLSKFHAHLADCFPYGEGDAKKKTYSLLGLMFAMHALLLILFKLYFFHYA